MELQTAAQRVRLKEQSESSSSNSPGRGRSSDYPLLQLQRAIGNERVRRLLHPSLRPKLEIGQPDDVYEQEADRVAEKVVSNSGVVPVVSLGTEKDGGLNGRHQDDAAGDKSSLAFESLGGEVLQRACSGCEEGAPCAECEEEERILQRKTRDEPDPSKLLTSEDSIQALGSGFPLDSATRNFMESSFGYDFDDVRIHDDAQAAKSASILNARAYTIARDVVFGLGEYAPGSERGRRLIAHELSHVIQQGNAKPSAAHVPELGLASLSRSPAHYIARQTQGLDDPLYPLQAGCVVVQTTGVSGGVPDMGKVNETCSKRTHYEGPDVIPSDEERSQYMAGTVLSEDRLRVLGMLLVEYKARLLAEKLTESEVTRIRDAIDYLAIPALERAGVSEKDITKALSLDPDPKVVQALRDPITASAATLAFVRLTAGAEGLSTAVTAEAVSTAVTVKTATGVALTVIEGGAAETAAATTATAAGLTAAELVPPLLLLALAIVLIIYIASLPEPRVDRRAPGLLEKAIQKIWRELETSRMRDVATAEKTQTQTKPAPGPAPEPFAPPLPAPAPKKKEEEECPFPTGTQEDPIPMIWYKPAPSIWYPESIHIAGIEYHREDGPSHLPMGEPIGVDPMNWPHIRQRLLLNFVLPEEKERPGMKKFKRDLERYGFDWARERVSPDHVLDIQFYGEDDSTNLWPMGSDANSLAGTRQYWQRVNFCITKKGPPITGMPIREMIRMGILKWFKIEEFRDPVLG